eukprot:TRINITY_DN10315_c1_g2_i1.p1 TRINITY_DN10315_c1_g2~~TRINITY_DN10315_c1_g2_i1.p1  ORF type:complete len:778 (+),score=206.71 TRINITY_DN10315_c1_g2_i1:193-2334(+)
MAPRLSAAGSASADKCPPTTLPALLKKCAEIKGDMPAMKVERPVPPVEDGKAPPALPEGDWTSWTFKQYHDDVRTAAKAFIKMGFQPFDTVNVWGFNSPEWIISSVAASFAGGKVGGLYPTDTPETAAYKTVHSGGAILVVEDRGKLDKLVKAMNARGDGKRLKAVVAWGFDPADGEKVSIKGCGDVPVYSWKAAMEMGSKESDAEVDKRIGGLQPGNCAALVYTSGTTGEPKAVMISHDNIIFESLAVLNLLHEHQGMGAQATQERILSYLPLSHIAGKMVDIACPIVATSSKPCWITTYFARPYDLKQGTIKDRLLVAKPTLFLGVPLVWEKIADKLRAIAAGNSGLKQSIGGWAKGLGLEYSRNCQVGGNGAYPTGYGLADTVVLSNVKAALGLDQCKFGMTGAAPIRVDTLEYFGSLGLNINEVYGMSECTAACTLSTDRAHQWGSCGFQLPGLEVKAFKVDPTDFNKKTEVPRAPDLETIDEEYMGELCFRGRSIMMGYLANPDLGDAHVAELQKKTAETIDNDGWLHSGDKGMVTVLGMTKITGRYKELIIGEGGENIAPVPIEDHVKKMCDGINEVMMVGDKRKYNVALVTLKAVGANGETPGTDNLDAGAKRVNPDVSTISAALDDKAWIDAITAAITSANNNGKVCPNNAFKIQKFTILPTNFSEEAGLLTPTKKLKRSEVAKVYAKAIDNLYSSKDTYVRYKE